MYKTIADCSDLKERVELMVMQFAKQYFHFDFSIVFYDVTTLYFESFTEDTDTTDEEGNITEKGLRKDGFSKDNKANQPQIVIGLIINSDGFPVGYEIFEGNIFEGDTFIPIITAFKKRYRVETLTVVADAAMISFYNVQKLLEHKLSYIVGARMASLKLTHMEKIKSELTGQTQDAQELERKDGIAMRLETERGLLVCDFSFKRYLKDEREMEKQIARAERLLQENKGVKRTKFLKNKSSNKTEQELNISLIEKTKLLLGIKGYYTNLSKTDNNTIVTQYHNLWQVEKAFRIAKSDLQMRPIYHFKRQTIEAHVLICFMALAVSKYMEWKTGISIKRIIQLLKSITDARIKNKLTGETIILRGELSNEVEQLWKTLTRS